MFYSFIQNIKLKMTFFRTVWIFALQKDKYVPAGKCFFRRTVRAQYAQSTRSVRAEYEQAHAYTQDSGGIHLLVDDVLSRAANNTVIESNHIHFDESPRPASLAASLSVSLAGLSCGICSKRWYHIVPSE